MIVKWGNIWINVDRIDWIEKGYNNKYIICVNKERFEAEMDEKELKKIINLINKGG